MRFDQLPDDIQDDTTSVISDVVDQVDGMNTSSEGKRAVIKRVIDRLKEYVAEELEEDEEVTDLDA